MTSKYVNPELNSLSLPSDKFAELMAAVLQNGTSFRFQASGSSMLPFIKDGDVLTLSNSNKRKIGLGDVVAFIDPACNKLTIHRLVGIRENHFLIKADNSQRPDGWVGENAILGYIINIERLHRPIRMGLGPERRLIAFLSRYNLLAPGIRFLSPLLRPFIKGIE